MMRWFVVQTRPHGEQQACAHLRNQQFGEVYLPCYRRLRRHARRAEWVSAPLFPRYLFVRMDVETTQWRAIRSTVGVAGLICSGEKPLPVPHGVVEAIRDRSDEHGFIRLDPPKLFHSGERVRIDAGTFAGQNGLFDCIDDNQRIVVLLELLGRHVRVQVPFEAVARAS